MAIDQSGSMDTYDPQDLRISETKYFIKNLKPTQQVGIVEFASEAYVKSELTSDHESLKDVLGTMYNPQYSGTNISEAIETAAGLFNDDNRHKIIILLTDGESNVRRGEEALVAKELKEEGIIINTIALGSEVDLDLMKHISKNSGGEHFYVETNTELSTMSAPATDNMQFSAMSLTNTSSSGDLSFLIDLGGNFKKVFEIKRKQNQILESNRQNSALPDPRNLRFAHDGFWRTKSQISVELDTALYKEGSDPVVDEVDNIYSRKSFSLRDSTYADNEEAKIDVQKVEGGLAVLNEFIEDLERMEEGVWYCLDELKLDENFDDLFHITCGSVEMINPRNDVPLGSSLEKKAYYTETNNIGDCLDVWTMHANVYDNGGISYQIDISRIFYTLSASKVRIGQAFNFQNESKIKLELKENFVIHYNHINNKIKRTDWAKLTVEDIKMAMQVEDENVYNGELMSGKYSKIVEIDTDFYQLFGVAASYIPYLKEAQDAWDIITTYLEGHSSSYDDNIVPSEGLGQKFPADGRDYDEQDENENINQLTAGESKKPLITPGDYLNLEGYVYIDEEDYSAYFFLEYSIGYRQRDELFY
ncbi:vWA domain-containing protein [Herbivorax sp. ANBcel31]|uniref:vWA domain-containing protein n=1 Tax=Herbivorax sp. ANBcel31 TaxID=3069754 RepID=UPI0027AE8B97|nr:vWA domain-containing protein [Herbivorax sp. ANBcel31]MDQ2087983.1 vWA domain-containing protein [Herbivorax sp. ANBcel31]